MSGAASSNVSFARSREAQANAMCPTLVAQNVLLGSSCFLGVTANLILIVFIIKHRSGKRTPDKLLIVNFASVDLLACIVGLPLHLAALNDNNKNSICIARFYMMFTSFAVNIMTFAAISVDRYDAVCRAPVRKITATKAGYAIAFIWLFAGCTTAAGGIGHILTDLQGEHVCLSPGSDIPAPAHHGKYAMLGVVSLWILPSLGVMFSSLFGIAKHVRDQSSRLRSILGTSGMKREVRLTKICVAIIVTYLLLWTPFAVMVMLRNKWSFLSVHCTYLWAYSSAFSSFTVVPIEYMVLDRRFISYLKQKCTRRPKGSVRPLQMEMVSAVVSQEESSPATVRKNDFHASQLIS